MLGWQHCRWGYHDIEEVEAVIKGYKDNSIPCKDHICRFLEDADVFFDVVEVKWIDIGKLFGSNVAET